MDYILSSFLLLLVVSVGSVYLLKQREKKRKEQETLALEKVILKEFSRRYLEMRHAASWVVEQISDGYYGKEPSSVIFDPFVFEIVKTDSEYEVRIAPTEDIFRSELVAVVDDLSKLYEMEKAELHLLIMGKSLEPYVPMVGTFQYWLRAGVDHHFEDKVIKPIVSFKDSNENRSRGTLRFQTLRD